VRHVVFDIETNGHLEQTTKVHSLVLQNWETDEVVSCSNDPRHKGPSIEHGLSLLSGAEIIFGHNILDFDLRALKKVYPEWKTEARAFDTLVAARLRWAHIKETDFALMRKGKLPGNLIGRHSLKAWGHRMGIHKGEYTDWCAANGIEDPWAEWRPEMQTYSERDVLVTRELLARIKKAGYSRQAMDNEHELALYLIEMEDNGWPLDMEKATALHAHLVGKREEAGQRLRDIFGQMYWRDGKPFTPKRDNRKLGYIKDATVQKLKIVDFNPGSRKHIADRLIKLYGWKPEEFTPGGDPKLDEDTINALPYSEAKDIAKYLLIDKRLGFLSEGDQALIIKATADRPRGGKLTGLTHIHPYINSGGTVTHRASHMRTHPSRDRYRRWSVDKHGGNASVGDRRPVRHRARESYLYRAPVAGTMVGVPTCRGWSYVCSRTTWRKWDDGVVREDVLLEGDPSHRATTSALGLATEEPADGSASSNARSETQDVVLRVPLRSRRREARLHRVPAAHTATQQAEMGKLGTEEVRGQGPRARILGRASEGEGEGAGLDRTHRWSGARTCGTTTLYSTRCSREPEPCCVSIGWSSSADA
jgi:hypothetical protein